MSKSKIDKVKMNQLLRSGKSQRECAQVFGVTEGAISKAKKELNINVVKNVALETAHQVVSKNLNTIDQLHKINKQANQLLDDLEQKPEMKLKIMAEIRGQLKLQLDIFQTLYDMRTIQEFQQEVLAIISSVNKEARNEILKRLRERRALRSTIQII
jgi:hypothetical protein